MSIKKRGEWHRTGWDPSGTTYPPSSDITFELSKINLAGATAGALGMRMGATYHAFDARSGLEAQPPREWRGNAEHIFYDSVTAQRTCLGALLQARQAVAASGRWVSSSRVRGRGRTRVRRKRR